MFGESVVMRVLDRSNVELEPGPVGLREDDLERFRQLIAKPNGIVIVTGPDRLGQDDDALRGAAELNDIETKILTAEDPVEYDIDGLCQVQVNDDTGADLRRALRSFLRQDPDIILVGEIRDLETAQIAVQASLTGHLVLTTLHTNDAPSRRSASARPGLEPFLLTATIEGIVAQRLVRTICPSARRVRRPPKRS
jgi:type IV pilus assembly protein PilB